MVTLQAMPEFTRPIDGVELEFHPATVGIDIVHFLGFISRRGKLIHTVRVDGYAIVGEQKLILTDFVINGCVVEPLMQYATGGDTLHCCAAIDTRDNLVRLIGLALTENRHKRAKWEYTF